MISILSTLQQADENPKRMNETSHTSAEAGCSQCDRILSLLTEANGEWVAMPFLSLKSRSLNIHSRIADLRKRGHSIAHENRYVGKDVHSFYKLNPPES